ncbi:hypothetical protein [Marinobacter salsuginis]|jgi:hypothetical protein|uniref:Uncharacterized protein n=1 Tax=Marinobacter salsuginis TaxID=418719 RepID=A0A5M3Q621_9GAMM|nr:hypothetical protein [Marinobacter salsuginis]GBO90444.1 hypothetical protein MSSD14B_41120 [Marinobacter salsuginis]
MSSTVLETDYSPQRFFWNNLTGIPQAPMVHQLLNDDGSWLDPKLHKNPWAPASLNLIMTQLVTQYPENASCFEDGDPRRLLVGTNAELVAFCGEIGILSTNHVILSGPVDVNTIHQRNPFQALDLPFNVQDWVEEIADFPMAYPFSMFFLRPERDVVHIHGFTPLTRAIQSDGSVWYQSPYPGEETLSPGAVSRAPCRVIAEIDRRMA